MAKKPQPAQKCLKYLITPSGPSTLVYVDLAKDLSIVNRRLYEQGKQYFVESIEFGWIQDPAVCTEVFASAHTAGDTWVVHNAHTKGKALWHEMNKLVLEDNPSIEGKWADYKVYLDDQMRTGTILSPVDWVSNPYGVGEWNYSDYVIPQHDVDPATGLPLPADQCQAHLVGPTVGAPGNFISVGLVDAYQESRARVQIAPSVPGGMSQSFFNLLTDSGSQEPELADVIALENDEPPYDLSDYPGGATNAPTPVLQEFAVATSGSPNAVMHGFSAECGLIAINFNGYLNGDDVTPAALAMKINVMPGNYKGVAALPMGQ